VSALASEDYSLTKFASHPFYTAMNQRLVELCELRPWQRVVDLGCGTGAVTKLILELMRPDKGQVVAVDPSPSALELASRDLQERWGAVVRFVTGQAENLSGLVQRAADAVVFCNAIHLVKDKQRVLREIYGSLHERGMFAFNSAFFEGAEPADTSSFYVAWVRRALRIFKNEYPDVRREREEKAPARIQLTPEEYRQLLEEQGFAVRHLELCPVELPLQGFQDISEYELFARGALPGVPLPVAADCLKRGVAEAFRDLGLSGVTRNWLQVVAEKT
jgi:ubiquinone/menaquinone biosynthesis C-methylase UbiE